MNKRKKYTYLVIYQYQKDGAKFYRVIVSVKEMDKNEKESI